MVGNRSQYQLRNSQNNQNVQARTRLLQKSCIPSSVSLWNNLQQERRNCTTFGSFKLKLSSMSKPDRIPSIYLIGNRRLSVIRARIRNNCSNLNNDLFLNHLKLNSICDCRNGRTLFFKCRRYSDIRITFFQSTRTLHPLNTEKLLFGDENLNDDENHLLFEAVQLYIKQSGRFSCIIYSIKNTYSLLL